MTDYKPAALLSRRPGEWISMTRAAPGGFPHERAEWRATLHASRSAMALALWRELGNPSLELRDSPYSEGLLSAGDLYHYWHGAASLETLAFAPDGGLLSIWALIDYGAQIACAKNIFAHWEPGYSRARRLSDWVGSGPVPGTGKKAHWGWWRSQQRSLRLGWGSRARMISALLASARLPSSACGDGFPEDGELWAWLPTQRGSLLRSAHKIGRDFAAPYDDHCPVSRERRSWKSRKTRKSWGGGTKRNANNDWNWGDGDWGQEQGAPLGPAFL